MRSRCQYLVRVGGLTLAFAFSLGLNISSFAQERLISFSGQHSDQLGAPTHAANSQSVQIDPAVLAKIRAGDSVLVEISPQVMAEVVIDEVMNFVNGDIGISARGSNHASTLSFTLTVGLHSLFGYIASSDGLWQIIATNNGEKYLGWVYQPALSREGGSELENDFIIPDYEMALSRREKSSSEVIPILPLVVDQKPIPDIPLAASTTEISPNNFAVEQVFSPSPVVAGKTTTAQITLTNTSGKSYLNLQLEVFFVLEDSELVTADATCEQALSVSLQSVLRCGLGDFQPGEQKVLKFTVRTQAQSVSALFSTIVIGDLRHDSTVNVVKDVRTDSDEDGISDFNEMLLGTNPGNSSSVDYSVSVIDVLVLYSQGAESAYPLGVETRINQLISVANQIYRDSRVAISLRPVHHLAVDYSDSNDMDVALDHLMNQTHEAFGDLDSLRSAYGADLVIFFRLMESSQGRCGLAPVGGFEKNGYFNREVEQQFAVSTIATDCPLDTVVAHELGHNMGLTHSHREDGYGGTFNFATGHGVDSQFVTIMAHPGAFNDATRAAKFSDPDSDCLGFACGVDADSEVGADAVQALNIVRHQIANYQPTVVPDLPSTSVTALSGTTNAAISIAASRDDGLSFSGEFSPNDSVDMSAVIEVDERHIGSEGSLHVLVGQRGGTRFYQLNNDGNLVEWNGSLEGLIPISGRRVLNAEERFTVLNEFQFGTDLVGLDLVFYVGYRVFQEEDLVYTDSPLSLRIIPSN